MLPTLLCVHLSHEPTPELPCSSQITELRFCRHESDPTVGIFYENRKGLWGHPGVVQAFSQMIRVWTAHGHLLCPPQPPSLGAEWDPSVVAKSRRLAERAEGCGHRLPRSCLTHMSSLVGWGCCWYPPLSFVICSRTRLEWCRLSSMS